MQITRRPGESDQAFRARAFDFNRLIASLDDLPKVDRSSVQATPVSFAELHAKGVPLAFGPTVAMSRVRAILYGAGLVFGGVLIAMAVFGMGR